MKALLQSLGDQIAEVEQGGSSTVPTLPEDYHDVKSVVEPLIKSRWGQDYPYFNLTPTAKNDKGETVHCPTGCVATATAMVMKYYEWPQDYTAPLPATKQQPALPAVKFDWASMTDTYSKNSPKAACDAVATLMQYCGSATKMDYDPEMSSSETDQLAFALIRYFGYDRNLSVIRRPQMSEWEWQDCIYQELAAKRPVICGGGGHEFIIDGYQKGDYFHINWGWDGDKDAYFQLSITANFGTEKRVIDHFPYAIVTGVKPTTEPYSQVGDLLATVGMILADDTPDEMQRTGSGDFPEVKVRMTLMNYMSEVQTNTFDAGLGLFDKDGHLLKVATASTNNQLKHKEWLEDQRASITFGKGLADGEYTLFPVSRVTGSNEWQPNDDVFNHYIIADISGEKLKLTVKPRDIRLKVNSITFSGDLTEGGKGTAVANVTNHSIYDFNAIIALVCNEDNTYDNKIILREQLHTVPAGKTVDLAFTFTADEAKTYKACLLYNVFFLGEPVPLTINPANNKDDIVIEKELSLDNSRLVGDTPKTMFLEVEGSVLNGTIKFRNTSNTDTYSGFVEATLLEPVELSDGTSNMSDVEKLFGEKLTLAPGESKEVQISSSKMESGNTYYIRACCSYAQLFVNDPKSFLMKVKSLTGINVYKNDRSMVSYAKTEHFTVPEDAVVVELENIGVTKVTPNSNPNCLYFLDAKDSRPSGLENSNVIIVSESGMTAETLKLVDGYDFMTPYDFMAQNVSYERTFTETELNGYTTLVLPFNAERCEAGGKQCSLQLLLFSGDVAGKVYFSPAEEKVPVMGMPYLVQLNTTTPLQSPVVFSAKDQWICDTISALAAGRYQMTGTYLKRQDTKCESFGFDLGKSGTSIPLTTIGNPFRALFQTIGMPTKYESLNIDSTTLTAIETPRTTPADSPQTYYNLQGQRVNVPRRGVYIRNGRLVLIK